MESYTNGEILEKCLTVLGGFSGIFTIAVGIARLFGKNLLAHWFNKDLEIHKASLTQTTNELKEKLRIEYGSLYKKRVEAIENLYAQLLYISDSKAILDSFENDPNNKFGQGWDTYQEDYFSHCLKITTSIKGFSKLVKASLIYLSKDDAVLLLRLSESLNGVFTEEYIELCNLRDYAGHREYMTDKGFNIIFSEDNNKLTKEILTLFRKLVGVKDE